MTTKFGRPVCGSCRKLFNGQLDDEEEWHEGAFEDDRFDLEYEFLCPECHAVVVEGASEERDWLLDRLELRAA